jgi:hypothetical protein
MWTQAKKIHRLIAGQLYKTNQGPLCFVLKIIRGKCKDSSIHLLVAYYDTGDWVVRYIKGADSHKAFLLDNTATPHFVSQEVQEMVSRRYHETTAALYRELDRMKATKGGEHYNEFVFRGSYDLNQEQVDRLLSNALSNEDASNRGKILHRGDLISFCLLPPFQHDSVPAKSQLNHMKHNSSANAGVAVWEGISYDLL